MVNHGRTWRRRSRKKVGNRPQVLLDPEYIRLLKWAKQNGVEFGNLRPAVFHDTGRGMLATQKITSGDRIISVPSSLLITTCTAVGSCIGNLFQRTSQQLNMKKLSHKTILCVFLVYLKHLGKKSFWYPYIATLPKDFNTPCYFSDEELRALPRSCYERCLLQLAEVRQAFDIIHQSYGKDLKDFDSNFRNLLTYENFRWAWFVVNTRSVYLAKGEKKCSCVYGNCNHGDNYALAPVLDLLNHTDTAEIHAAYLQNSYKICTTTEYQRRQQVFINYGPHDNTTLLIEYGFILPQNIHNAFKFTPSHLFRHLESFSPLFTSKKLDLIRRNGFEKDFSCSETDGLSWSLLVALRIVALPDDKLSQWNTVLDGKPVSKTDESLVHQWVSLLLSHMLKVLEKDDDSIITHTHTYNKNLALKLRAQEKQILRKALCQLSISSNV